MGHFEKYCLTRGTVAFNFGLASCLKMLRTEIFMKMHTTFNPPLVFNLLASIFLVLCGTCNLQNGTLMRTAAEASAYECILYLKTVECYIREIIFSKIPRYKDTKIQSLLLLNQGQFCCLTQIMMCYIFHLSTVLKNTQRKGINFTIQTMLYD